MTMPVLLQYRRDDRTITGRWEATTREMLAPQIVPDDPVYGYLVTDISLRMGVLHDQYYVGDDGVLTAKTVLTLTASPTPFAADGATICAVTVTPFVPCTLVVDGTEVVLTPEDPILELTADSPHTFQAGLVPLAGFRADPLRVEAV